MHVDDRDWSALDAGEQIRTLEVEGYVVIPRLLDAVLLRRLNDAARDIRLQRSNYTDKQWFAHDVQWEAQPAVLEMIANSRTLDFLGRLFADDLVCLGASYSRSDPGYPGMALHTDSHPYGSNLHAARGTSPVLVRVLYYLEGLTPQRAPLKVVPSSHLSLHSDAMPYRRYRAHPEERVVVCGPGDAVVINHRVFHAAAANTAAESRQMFAASYRPGWARPVQSLPEHSQERIERIERIDPAVAEMFRDPNRGFSDLHIVNWSDELRDAGTGLGPRRWQAMGDR